jgi:hypothetical protein
MNEPKEAGSDAIVSPIHGVPPEFLAIGSMLSIQLGAALAVPVMASIGPALERGPERDRLCGWSCAGLGHLYSAGPTKEIVAARLLRFEKLFQYMLK